MTKNGCLALIGLAAGMFVLLTLAVIVGAVLVKSVLGS